MSRSAISFPVHAFCVKCSKTTFSAITVLVLASKMLKLILKSVPVLYQLCIF